ncbi:hypothetical protein [Streptomyces sp. NPDC046261]|uniref:hypothetical protein n=1 Tax=Streptomyces sp. NPDC046261 TaxID=3157200 RepID=UPI0033CA4182
MSVNVRSVLRLAPAVAVIAACGIVAPQASATEQPVPGVKVSATASKETVEFAKASPKVAAAAANACGAGYVLNSAVPLPKGTDPKMRLATLFNYTKGGNDSGCSIYDNNTGKAQNMFLKVCSWKGDACQEDKGKFSEYAGPVRTSEPVCATVTAYITTSSGVRIADYKSEYAYLCN